MSVITIENVSKSYGNVQAVSNLNLKLNQGEIYGFIGPNGAGKSTTIRMLLNFISYDTGRISVLGYDPAREDIEIKKQTGYVASDTFMYSNMKVSDLFRFTESFHGIRATERIKMLVSLLDIDTHKRFGQLSYGNRKKVSVACALLHSPRLLILDEPSNGLDPVIRRNLYDLLLEEKKKGVSIFFSSHVLHEVQRFCDRIGLIKHGQLIKESVAADFTDIGYRQVRIEAENIEKIENIEGVAGLEMQGRQCHFMYSGDMNRLIAVLSSMNVHSIHIEEPELENVFMHYFN
ncbi:MAG TPA: ABC transporter ATP-binding protein [Bacteroidales bacterium]|nr:ABC transporter ATP-binding protein [Bacteroidales bacterium]